jgi:hypothetical protein
MRLWRPDSRQQSCHNQIAQLSIITSGTFLPAIPTIQSPLSALEFVEMIGDDGIEPPTVPFRQRNAAQAEYDRSAALVSHRGPAPRARLGQQRRCRASMIWDNKPGRQEAARAGSRLGSTEPQMP